MNEIKRTNLPPRRGIVEHYNGVGLKEVQWTVIEGENKGQSNSGSSHVSKSKPKKKAGKDRDDGGSTGGTHYEGSRGWEKLLAASLTDGTDRKKHRGGKAPAVGGGGLDDGTG